MSCSPAYCMSHAVQAGTLALANLSSSNPHTSSHSNLLHLHRGCGLGRMPRSVPCRYFLQGRCNKGEDCAFYHGPSGPEQQPEVCRFYQRGFCANGLDCRFHHPQEAEDSSRAEGNSQTPLAGIEHTASITELSEEQDFEVEDTSEAEDVYDEEGRLLGRIDGSGFVLYDSDTDPIPPDDYDQEEWEVWATSSLGNAPDLEDRSICHYFHVNGCCPNWRTCPHPHGIFCETCGKWCLHPYNESQRIAHTQQCNERAQREAVRAASAEQECSICLEKVLEKPIAERRFGLLSCNHPFCLGCIKNWRTEGGADVDTALRACPVCRKATHYVTPSKVWPRTAEEKAAIVAQYKQRLSTIDCKYWLRGNKSCPFGTSCFYRHKGQEGMPAPRKFLSADGEVKFGNPVLLSQFLGDLSL